MNSFFLALNAVFCNVGAQLAIKLSGRYVFFSTGLLALISPMLIIALALYGLSFFLTVRVYAVNELSVAAPFMAGGAFLLVALVSALVLSEGMTVYKTMGMVLIVLGLYLLTRK